MIDNATVERIYAAADIVEVVSDFVTLRRAGVNYKACCPFHNEKTPSFVVSPAKGLFKCFGCGKGGNAVTFVMEHERLTYPEALKYVARKYNIEVEEREQSAEEQQQNDDRESMMTLNGWAAEYFAHNLNSGMGLSVGRSYLAKRAFTDSTIERFRLGYCPAEGDTMTRAALADGYREQFLVDTGLTIKRDNGTHYDRFAGRVIFPIHSISGRVIGFGGRTMRSDDRAKYLNSPESAIYNKSHTLYGIYFAKQAITRENYCILVEGYADVIQMHQRGIENVVASSGTSLTVEQVRLIARFTKNITIIYDGDSAGIKAAIRGIDLVLREGLNVRIVLLPPDDDPDSFARTHTAEQIADYISSNEEDFIRFKTNLLLREAGDDPIKRAAIISDVVTSIAAVPDQIQRAVFIKECARLMDIGEQVLVDETARRMIGNRYGSSSAQFARNQQSLIRREADEQRRAASVEGIDAGSSVEELEKEITGYLIKYGELYFDYKVSGSNRSSFNVARTIIDDIARDGIEFTNPVYRTIFNLCHQQLDLLGEGVKVPEHLFINHPDPEVCTVAVDILTGDSKYVESQIWQKHEIYLETEEQRLSYSVPRVVTLYKSKAVEAIIKQLNDRLATVDPESDEYTDILRNITALNTVRTEISRKTDRLIL